MSAHLAIWITATVIAATESGVASGSVENAGIFTGLSVFAFAALLSLLFSGYETAFVSSNHLRVRVMAEEEKNSQAAKLLRHFNRPDQMLATILLGNNIANVAATISISLIMAALVANRLVGDLITMIIVTPLVLIFCELIPKSVARAHPNHLALYLLRPVRVIYVLLWPLSTPVAVATRLLLNLVGRTAETMSSVMTSVEDVRGLIDETAEHGTIEPEEQEMIHSVINLQETQAKAIMSPRIDIQALPRTATRDELLDLFESCGRSRIPIYEDSIDNIVGVVNVHDAMLDTTQSENTVEHLIREVKHVPDTMKVDDLLKEFKASKSHIAIVIDEYGGTFGLVTLEDILEEIFGEIQDEHDREESPIQKVGKNAYVIDARMPLEEASEAMGISLVDEEVDSVGGWIMHIAERIPAPGEVIEHEGYRLTVLSGKPNFISKVRIDLPREAKRPEDA